MRAQAVCSLGLLIMILCSGAATGLAQFPNSTNVNESLPAGSITKNGSGSYTVVGGGADIWDTADQFFFAYSEANGDFDIKVRVQSLQERNRWSKAGLMVRESLAADSRMVFNRVTPTNTPCLDGSGNGANDTRLAYRTGLIDVSGANGGQHEDGSGSPGYPNAWLRLRRTNNTIVGYRGSDGRTWTTQNTLDTSTWQGGAMPARLLIGLAVTSHSQGNGATVAFRDLAPTTTNLPAIVRHPTNTVASPGSTATLSVGLSGFDPNWIIQWRTNGVKISGATNLSYTTWPLTTNDSGRLFSVTVSNAAGGVVSGNALLTVGDFTPPRIASVSTRGNPNGITLTWSETLGSAATNLANYRLNNGLSVTGARFGASNAVVVLTTGTMTEGVSYSLTISNVQDRAVPPNIISPNPTLVSFVHGAGYEPRPIQFKKFQNLTGVLVSDLTNNAAFPGNPHWTAYPSLFEDPSPSDDQSTNNYYGGQLSGIFVPTLTGDHTFYMSADDQGIVFLSTDDQPANRVTIAFEPQWNSARNYTGTDRRNPAAPENISAPIPLVAGQQYHLEALLKEGGGGNNLSVAVQEPGQGIPSMPLASTHFAPVRYYGSQTFFTLGSVFFTRQPASATVDERDSATFSASADGTPPYFIQWHSNGMAIAGATNFSYTTPPLSTQPNGANYTVVVSNEFSSATSTNARLTVIPDTLPPTLVLVQNVNATNVVVTFSEEVEMASATNRSHYTLSGGVVISQAELAADGRTGILTVTPLVYGGIYTLTVNAIRDRATTPNGIATNSQFTFVVTEYTPTDIGNPALAGSSTKVAGGLDITGCGTDIGGMLDQFHFEYQRRSGDFDVQVRLASLDVSDAWAQAGLMARETLDGDARFAGSWASPSLSGCFFEYRGLTGGSGVTAGSFPANYPNTWLRLQRVGNQFSSYASFDGQIWTSLGSAVIAMSNSVFLGFAVTSHNTNQTTTALFRDFSTVLSTATGTLNTGLEPPGPCSRKTPFAITEIMYKPALRTDGRNLEFIEIFNSNPFVEDLSGYRLSGNVEFTFPAGTSLPGGGMLVVAKVPTDVQSAYGLHAVLGPYQGSLSASGLVRLRNREGSILLEINYANKLPWPVAADGTGHSLVLARPSYGEANPHAWAPSDVTSGSPGQIDAFRPSPLRNVVINEFLAHTDPPLADFIELYNHSPQAVDVSGCWLSDDPATNRFRIPAGTWIPAGGFLAFDASQLGFALNATGESIFFVNPSQTRVLDALSFGPQQNAVSSGRWPDGAGEIYPLAVLTPGTNNGARNASSVVLNEIMYAPLSGDPNDEFVEIHNRSAAALNLTGWKLNDGIDFDFPDSTWLTAGGYLVVAKNRTNLLAKYPSLTSNNCLGNYSGSLANRGERLAVTRPEDIVNTNVFGQPVTNRADIVVDEVTYGVGGRWGNWAREGGSSLELIDARANQRLAYNWADSDETAKAPWTLIAVTNILDQGSTYNDTAIDRLEVILLGEGECLVDNVEVIGSGGTNVLANGTFESGISPWVVQGNHLQTHLATAGGYGGGQCLHVKATDRGDTGANRIRVALTQSLTAGQTAAIRARVRWLRGWPEIVLRLKGNFLEATGWITVPANLGTPGLPNSRATNNAPPALYEVAHSPVVPAAGQAVVVTARIQDPDGVSSFQLKYRIDPATIYSTVTMVDDGTDGDAVAGDGIFSATIPGQSSGILAAFYLVASDTWSPPASSQFPRGASPTTSECLVRFGDPVPTSGFGTYRLWLTQHGVSTWINRPSLSNERVEGTFVYGNFRAVHNMGSKYSGSPYHQGFSSPLNNCHISSALPADDMLLGTDNFNKIHQPGNGAGDDITVQREQTGYWMVRQLGLPWNYRRYVAMYVNGVRKGNFMEDTQVPGGDVIDAVFPDDPDGDLYKLQPWFEFDDVTVTGSQGAGFNNKSWCTLNQYDSPVGSGQHKRARYRHNYLKRAVQFSANDYTNVFHLIDAANTGTTGWTNYIAAMESIVDVDQWMRIFAIEHAVGNWDSFGNNNAQNMYAYKPPSGKWWLLIWDFNILLNNSGTGTGSDGPVGDDLFKYNGSDGNLGKLYAAPTFRRMYWRALYDIVNGPMAPGAADSGMEARYAAITAAGQNVSPPATIKDYITQRRAYIQSQLNTVAAPFTAGSDFSTTSNLVTLAGTAPVGVKTIRIDGITYRPHWSTITNWTLLLPLSSNVNRLVLQGYDTFGNPLAGASDALYVTNTGPVALPTGNVVINEIMYHSATDGGSFVEIHNAHPAVAFDLSNWRLDGADFTFPEATILWPGQFLVIAANAERFAAAYGTNIPMAGVFNGDLDNGGETLKLVKPGAPPELDQIIDLVRYDDDLPWPAAADGTGPSLQLLDPTQDNGRAGNWAAVPIHQPGPHFTPGIVNSVRTSLTPFPLIWLNEVQVFNASGPTDNAGQRDPWIELYNASGTAISLSGLYLTDTFTNLLQWPFPEGASLAAGQFLVVWADGEAAQTSGANYHTSFRLTNGMGSVGLVGVADGQTNVLDYLNYFSFGPDHSYGSYPDGQPQARQLFAVATPGATNDPALPPVAAVVNEWMADNAAPAGFPDPADGFFQDWFELYNPNTNAVDLSGYYLTDNLSQWKKWQVPAGTVVPAGGFLLVWADNNTAQNGQSTNGDLHAGFQLNNDGEAIGLFSPDGTSQHAVTFGPQLENISQGFFPDGSTGGAVNFMTNFTPRSANKLTASNRPPVLEFIPNLTSSELSLITFTATASDPDAGQSLTFSLEEGFPAGAVIGSASGVFAWMPTEVQGPGVYSVTVRVSDNGSPRLAATQTVMLTVTEVNAVPILTPVGGKSVVEGTQLSFIASASDSDQPVQSITYSLIGEIPLGASLHPVSGVFTWTPTEAQGPATYTIALRASDNGSPPLSDTEVITVTVLESNSAPVLAALTDRTVDEQTSLTFSAAATDADWPPQALSFSLVAAPMGATIEPATGLFTWTPTESQGPTTNLITIRVADSGSPELSDQQSLVAVVGEANLTPVLAGIGNKTASEGALLSFTASASDADLPAQKLMFSLDAGAPVGASVNATNGLFTWTPSETQGGTTNVITVRVTDDGTPPLSTSETVRMMVSEVNSPPSITPVGPKTVDEGTPLQFTVTATDPDLPSQSFRFALDAGAPVGAAINPTNGTFTWTPTEAQGPSTNTVIIRVTDEGTPATNTAIAVTVMVNEVNTAPQPAAISNQTLNEGSVISLAAAADDADLPAQTLTYSLVSAPAGASINTTNGQFLWTPTEAQGPSTNVITVRVTDSGSPSLSASNTFTLVVNEVNAAPVLAPVGDQVVNEGSTLAFTVAATDSDLPALTLSFLLDAGAPVGAVVDPASGAFSWTPTSAQAPSTNRVTVRVKDAGSPALEDFETITITVIRPAIAVQLLSITNAWRYNPSGSDLGSTWPEADYDDAAWPVGSALLYHESAALPAPKNTPVSLTNASGNHIITYYFRSHFYLPAEPAEVILTASNLLDDGAIFHLNGVEVGRYNMPAGAVNFITLASSAIGDATSFFVTNLDATGLRLGDNVLAVEVHQVNSNSTDLVFGLALNALVPGQAPLAITNQPASLTVAAGDSAQFRVDVTGSAPQYQWLKNGFPLTGANTPVYTIPFALTNDAGSYSVIVSNLVSSVMSSNAVLQVNPPPNTPPALAFIGNQVVNENATLSFTATATDSNVPAQTLTFSLDAGAPAGASIHPITGLFTWTPGELQGGGDYIATIRVRDSGEPPLNDFETIVITVNEVNSPPALDSISSKTISEGSLLEFAATASDSDLPAQVLSYSLDPGAPVGASIHPTTGVFAWTPNEAQGPSTNSISIRVTDNGTPAASRTTLITIMVAEENLPPALNSLANISTNEGATITVTAMASDPDLPTQTLTFALVRSPTGATIHPHTGVFTWTPAESQAPSTNSVIIMVTDNGSPTLAASNTFTLVVNEVNSAPVLAAIGHHSLDEGSSLTVTALAMDDDRPAQSLTFSLAEGSPIGARIDPASGVFTWTPTEAQAPSTNSVTIVVSDNGSPALAASNTFSIVVNEVNSAPVLAAIGHHSLDEGSMLTITALATDGDWPGQSLTFSLAEGSPIGARIDPASGVFTWTPTEAQGPSTNEVIILVTDNGAPALSASTPFSIVVNEVNSAPLLSATGDYSLDEGSTLMLTATATDADWPAQALTFRLAPGAPAGATIHPTTGVFTWTPTETQGPGTNITVIVVTDNGAPALSASNAFSISVNEANSAPVLAPIGDQSVKEGTFLTFTAIAADSDVPAQTLAFSLEGTAPAGASLTTNGVFTWTPTEAQGPSTNEITVRVTDDGAPTASDVKSFTIFVTETNTAPALALIGNKTTHEGSLLSFTVSATDDDVPAQALAYSLDAGAPAGAAIHPSTGLFTWTPNEGQGPSTNFVTIRATDNGLPPASSAETISITVNEVNSVPALNPISNFTNQEGVLITFTASAADNDWPAQALTFSLIDAPPGATIDPSTGLFSWTPTEAQGPCTNSLAVVVTDNGSPAMSSSNAFTIVVTEVNAGPVLASVTDQNVNEGSLIQFNASATDTDLPAQVLTFSLAAGAPAGATISTNGVFTWTPDESQGPSTNRITIQVADHGLPPLTDARTFSAIVHEANQPPQLTALGSQTIAEGSLLTFTAAATDPDQPAQRLSFTLDAGSPAGAAITTNGLFTWRPDESQGGTTNSFTVRVTDDGSPPLSATATITVTVWELNTAPSLSVVSSTNTNEGQLLTFTAIGADSDLPSQTLTFRLGTNAPTNAAMDSATGLFTWAPAEVQGGTSNLIEIVVTDSGMPPLSATQTVLVVVNELNSAPVLNPVSDQAIHEGDTLSFVVNAFDTDLPGQVLQFHLENAPTGAALDASSGLFTWIPTEAQGPATYGITAVVTDSGSPPLSATNSFAVTVNESNNAPVLAPLGPLAVAEGQELSFIAAAEDSDLPAQSLTFSLVAGPLGAEINPASGRFTWTPTERQGPSTNWVTIAVTDDGAPPLAGTNAFSVIVTEVNTPPVLAYVPNQTISEGSTLSLNVAAADDDVPSQSLTFSLAPGAPAEASLNPTSGILTWTPVEADGPSTNVITIRVTDNGSPPAEATGSFLVQVTELNAAPILASLPEVIINEGDRLALTVTATDEDLPAQELTFSLTSGVPEGASIEPKTGIFTWTPAESQGPSTNTITVRIQDQGIPPQSASTTLVIVVNEVNSPPTLVPVGDQTVEEGSTLVIDAAAADDDLPAQTLAFSLGIGAPAGAAINPVTGRFTWTPGEAQGPSTNAITIVAADAGSPSRSASNTFTVVAVEVNAAPIISPIVDRIVEEGTRLALTVVGEDYDLPAQTLTYALGAGAPAGAAIHPTTGAFAWTPSEMQGGSTNTITVQVTDSGIPARSASYAFTVIVNEVNEPPVLLPIGPQMAQEHTLLTFAATARDPDLGQTLTFSLDSGAPTGAAINPTNGLFAWTPDESQGGSLYPITIRVTDNGSPALHTAETIQVTVEEQNKPPAVAAVMRTNISEGDLLTFVVTASDPDVPAQTLTFGLEPGAPADAAFNPTQGILTWTPDEAYGGTTNFLTIRVTDNGHPPLSVTQTVEIVVAEANSPPILSPLGNKHVAEGGRLSFAVTALDPDFPVQTLTYSLDSFVPEGLSIDPVTGWVEWGPTEEQGPSSHLVTVRAIDDGTPPLSTTQMIRIDVSEVNSQPVLVGIADHTVDEEGLLLFVVAGSDPDVPPQPLTFSLAPGAPPGATLDPYTGLFAWAPHEVDGPGTNLVTIQVTDGFSPAGMAAQTVRLVVNEVNSAPALLPISDQTVNAGQPVHLTALAADSDLPVQPLTFSLEASAPVGSTIEPATGQFYWLAPYPDSPVTNRVSVRVSDGWTPSLSDAQNFHIIVVPQPRIAAIVLDDSNGNVTLTWTAFHGKTYRVQFTEDLTTGTWTDLDPSIVATDTTVTFLDSTVRQRQRIYRVVQLD